MSCPFLKAKESTKFVSPFFVTFTYKCTHSKGSLVQNSFYIKNRPTLVHSRLQADEVDYGWLSCLLICQFLAVIGAGYWPIYTVVLLYSIVLLPTGRNDGIYEFEMSDIICVNGHTTWYNFVGYAKQTIKCSCTCSCVSWVLKKMSKLVSQSSSILNSSAYEIS
jgi:hypothetical protein